MVNGSLALAYLHRDVQYPLSSCDERCGNCLDTTMPARVASCLVRDVTSMDWHPSSFGKLEKHHRATVNGHIPSVWRRESP